MAFYFEHSKTESLSFLVTHIVILVIVGSDITLLSQLQFVVGLGDKVSPTDIEEGMRVG